MPDIKLVVSDVDHTLIMTREDEFPEQVMAAVKQLKQKEIGFTLASGRLPYMLDPYLKAMKLDMPVVACSGGMVYHGEKVLAEQTYPLICLKHFIQCADELEMTILYSMKGEEYCYRETEGARHKKEQRGHYHPLRSVSAKEWNILSVDKVIIMDDTGRNRIPLLRPEEEQVSEDIVFTHYSDAAVEVTPGGVNKATGIARICDYLSIRMEQVLAVGDNENDIEMIRQAGIGIAVANAKPELKEIADYVCVNPGPDGVVEAIRRYCF